MTCAGTERGAVDPAAVDHASALDAALRRASQPSLPEVVVEQLREFVAQCHGFIEGGVACGAGAKHHEAWCKGLTLQAFVDNGPWSRHAVGAELLRPLFAAYVKAGVIPVRQHPDSPRHPETGKLMHWRPLEQAVIGLSSDTMVALLECGADPLELGEDGDAAGFIRSNQGACQAPETTALFRETVLRLRLRRPSPDSRAPSECTAPRRRLGV